MVKRMVKIEMFHDDGDDIGNDGIKEDGKKTQLKKPKTYMEKTVTVALEMTKQKYRCRYNA